jgi:hypothetical protein
VKISASRSGKGSGEDAEGEEEESPVIILCRIRPSDGTVEFERREINRLYKLAITRMKKVIKDAQLEFQSDPLDQSTPVFLYAHLKERCIMAIDIAQCAHKQINILYNQYITSIETKRGDAASRVADAHRLATRVRDEYNRRYALVEEGVPLHIAMRVELPDNPRIRSYLPPYKPIVDSYNISTYQQSITESANTELGITPH